MQDTRSCSFVMNRNKLKTRRIIPLQRIKTSWRCGELLLWDINRVAKNITNYRFVTCLSSYAAHLSPCKGEIARGFISIFLFCSCGVCYFSPFHLFTFKLLTNCKFWRCQEIGSNFARVPTKSSNLFLARKNARILRFCIALIINSLCILR